MFFRQGHTEDETQFLERMETYQRGNAAAKTFCLAIADARKSAKFAGLRPYQLEGGELTYNNDQGAKAACHAMEDVSATLQIQLPILERLDRIATLLKICLAVLTYIAFRVS